MFASDVEAGKKKSASAWRLLALAKEETLVRYIQGASMPQCLWSFALPVTFCCH